MSPDSTPDPERVHREEELPSGEIGPGEHDLNGSYESDLTEDKAGDSMRDADLLGANDRPSSPTEPDHVDEVVDAADDIGNEDAVVEDAPDSAQLADPANRQEDIITKTSDSSTIGTVAIDADKLDEPIRNPDDDKPDSAKIDSKEPPDRLRISDSELEGLMPDDPFAEEDLDEILKETEAVSVDWPNHDADILSTDEPKETNSDLDKIHDETGRGLISTVRTALENVRDTDSFFNPGTRTEQEEGSPRYTSHAEWKSPDESVSVRIDSFDPAYIEGEAEDTKCVINGSSNWVDGISDKLGTSGPFTLSVKYLANVPYTGPNGDAIEDYSMKVEQRFLIPTLSDGPPRISWTETIPEQGPTTSDTDDEEFVPMPLTVLGSYLDHDEKSPGVRMAEVDSYLVRAGLVTLMESQMGTDDVIVRNGVNVPNGIGSEDSVGTLDDFRELEAAFRGAEVETKQEVVKTAFKTLIDLDIKALVQDRENFDATPMSSVTEEIRQASRVARATLEKQLAGDSLETTSISNGLASLAELASIRDDLESVQQYCRILETMPQNEAASALAKAYYSAVRLGDEESSSRLDALLKDENDRFTEKWDTDETRWYEQGQDRKILTTIVEACAEHGVPANSYIDRFTTAQVMVESDDDSEETRIEERVDEWSRWSLRIAQSRLLEEKGISTGSTESIESLLGRLTDPDMGGLGSEFVRANIPEVIGLAESPLLRAELVQRYVDLTATLDDFDINTFNDLADFGYDVLADKELAEEHPAAAINVASALDTMSDDLRPEMSDHDAVEMDITRISYSLSIMVRNGATYDEIKSSIDAERHKWATDRAGVEDPVEANLAGDSLANKFQPIRDRILIRTAAQYAASGNFNSSQLAIYDIQDSNNRTSAYAECWAHAESVEQVQSLVPRELSDHLFSGDLFSFDIDLTQDTDGETLDLDTVDHSADDSSSLDQPIELDTDTESPAIVELYETELATKSGDIGKMIERAVYLGKRLTEDGRKGADLDLTSDLRSDQLDTLFTKITELDPAAARKLAPSLIEARFNGDPTYLSHASLQKFYNTLGVRGLSTIIQSISKMPNESVELRAARLAELSKQLMSIIESS